MGTPVNFVDLILVVGLLWAAVKGWRIGLLQSLIVLIGLVLAYGFALSYGAEASVWITGDSAEKGSGAAFIGFLSVFLLTLLASTLAGRMLRKALRSSPFGIFDAVGGAAVGLANALLILGLLVMLLRAHPPHSKLTEYIDTSSLGQPTQRAAVLLLDGIKAALPRTASLYEQLVPQALEAPSHPILDKVSDKADAARAVLDSLMEESRKRLESRPEE